MKLDTALIKRAMFWAAVIIAWTIAGPVAYRLGWLAIGIFLVSFSIFLWFLFARWLPKVRK